MVSAARRKETTNDQELFTKEEYLKTFIGNDINTSDYFENDNDFLDLLLEKSGTKHYNHLRFLSSKHKHDLIKLRLVQKPFSFIFLLQGINNNHIVWETLDTEEATYIWIFTDEERQIKQNVAHIDKTISLIVRNGKSEYLSQNEDNFNRVFHDYTNMQTGFVNWKVSIEKIILE